MFKKKLAQSGKLLVFFIVMVAACQPGPNPTRNPTRTPVPSATSTPTSTPVTPTPVTPTPTPLVEFTLSRDTNQVSYGSADPLSALIDSLPVPFPEGYQISTDTAGVGVLRGSASVGGCTIYVFRSTTLKKAACQPGTYAGSNVSCVEEGSALYNQCSGHIVITPSGVAEHKYTTLSVTYLPEQQITLFMALEGAVDVRPLRRLGDFSQVSEAVRLETGQFFYTAPDDRVATFSGIPMRMVQPLSKISSLVTNLGLLTWFEQTQSALDKQNLPMRLLPADLFPPTLTVVTAGKPLNNISGQEALLSGAPWAEFADSAIQIKGLELTANTLDPGEPLDIRQFTYDPAFTIEILNGMDYPDGFTVIIYYAEGNKSLAVLARQLADSLSKVKIRAKVAAAPVDRIPELMKANQDQGQATIWLRFDNFSRIK